MNNSLSNVSVHQLKQAITIRERIEALEAELGQLLGGSDGAATPTSNGRRKRRGMSAAGRARIAAAQKARWAKIKGNAAVEAPRRRRKISAAARARISAAAKARWKKAKAAGRSRL
jgi:hypothetical protein